MKSPFDGQKIAIDCPKCSHKIHEQISRLRASPKLTCPSCGVTINVDASDLDQKLRGVEKELGDLGRSLSKTFKLKL